MSGRDWRARREAARARAAEERRLRDAGNRGEQPLGPGGPWDGEKHRALIEAIMALTDKLGVQQDPNSDVARRIARRETIILGAVLLVLIVSLGGDWITWRSNRESHRDAGAALGEARRASVQALRAAAGANRMSRDALDAVERAFVFAAGVRMVASRPMAGDHPLTYIASIDWENGGATPTRNLTTSVTTIILRRPIGRGLEGLREPRGGVVRDMLGPHQRKKIGYVKIPAATLLELQRTHRAVYLVGRADYQDVLSDRWHVSEQCVELTPFIGDPARLDGGFAHQAVPCPTLNCADSECRTQQTDRARPMLK